MQAISAINSYTSLTGYGYSGAERALTNITKTRLHALGVDTYFIKTEAQGLSELRKARAREADRERELTQKANKNNAIKAHDDIMQILKYLARDIGLILGENDDINQNMYRINNRIEELKVQAGNDPTKLAKIADYKKRLDLAKSIQKSMIDLSATMSLTANMNIAFHNL